VAFEGELGPLDDEHLAQAASACDACWAVLELPGRQLIKV